MNQAPFSILSAAFNFTFAVFAILAASLAFLEVYWPADRGRRWFRQKWQRLEDTSWLDTPQLVIRWFVRLKATIVRSKEDPEPFSIVRRAGRLILWLESNWSGYLLFAPVVAASIAAFWISAGFTTTVVIHAGFVSLIVLEDEVSPYEPLFSWFAALYTFCYAVFVVYFWVMLLFRFDVSLSTIALLVMMPWIVSLIMLFLYVIMNFVDLWLGNLLSEWVALFAFGFGPSILLTFAAFTLGLTIYPEEWIPRTFQMVIVNLLCDGATLLATYLVLSRAMSSLTPWRIPVAIIIDIIIAALLAWLSLYGGLFATERALSRTEVLNVLVARTPDGSEVALGPLFWVMHTTFIPTGFYLTMLAIAWLGKLVLLSVKTLLGIGYAHENPLKLSATFCALVAAISKGIAIIVGEVALYLRIGDGC